MGSVSLVSCFDRQRSFADAFLAAAATFFESHLLSDGVPGWPPPQRGRCSRTSRSPRSPRWRFRGTSSLRSAFVKSFVTVSSGFWLHGAAGTLPFASALESHWSVLEIALPDDLSLLPSHLSARAMAGCRSDAVARIKTSECRRECMSGWPPRCRRASASRMAHVDGMISPSSSRLLPTLVDAMNCSLRRGRTRLSPSSYHASRRRRSRWWMWKPRLT